MFYRVISKRMNGEFEEDSYEGNKAAYLGMGIEKVSDSNSEGIILDSDNYEGGISHIEIPHERARRRHDALTEAERTISRSEFGKLIRIARSGAIYDASAAAKTFSVAKWSIF